MSSIDLLLLGLALAMDAFAVSIAKGMIIHTHCLFNAFKIAFFFAFFQGLMPFLGFMFGSIFDERLTAISHLLSFLILTFLGIQMIRNKEECDECLDIKNILILSIATSLDAMAAGLSLAFLEVDILIAIIYIMGVTFFLCFLGVMLGKKLNRLFKNKASLFGGILLIFIGLKIIIDQIHGLG